MSKQIQQLLFPPIAGLLFAFGLFVLNQFLLFKLYLPYDPESPSFFDPFVRSVYTMLFITSLFVVVLFQILISNRIFEKYKKGKKIFGLNLVLLIII